LKITNFIKYECDVTINQRQRVVAICHCIQIWQTQEVARFMWKCSPLHII